MFLGSVLATVVALIICLVIIKFPKSVGLTLRLHATAKHGTGEYFLSPEPKNQSFGTVIRRSLYGSLLVVGIALTVISFDLMVDARRCVVPTLSKSFCISCIGKSGDLIAKSRSPGPNRFANTSPVIAIAPPSATTGCSAATAILCAFVPVQTARQSSALSPFFVGFYSTYFLRVSFASDTTVYTPQQTSTAD